METAAPRLAFNRGLVSPLGMARADIRRMAMAAEIQTNWMPSLLGAMMLRAGLGYLGSSRNDAATKHVPFVFSNSQKALIELTDAAMRVWISDALITRPSVTSAVANGNFDSNLTSWTDNDEAGGTSVWVAGGYMGLTGNGEAFARRDQQVTVAGANIGVEHALRIIVQRGPVILRVGSTSGGDEYISETELQTGTHSLAFTPTGDFHIRFMSSLKRQVLVDSCNVESAGVMSITAPWAAADLGRIRYDQSGDVIFVACAKVADNIGYQQYRIERRATRSWSVVKYYADDGPFRSINDSAITMTPGALSGNTTLTASDPFFKSTNVGSLFRLLSDGQAVSASISGDNTFTNPIRVTNIDNQRIFSITVDEDAAGAATFTLQRSLVSDTGPWTDVEQYTADTSKTFDDGLDNQIAWYRLGVKTGDYVNGTHSVALNYTVGSITGVCRVTGFTSSTVVDVEVITDFGGTAATDAWFEGKWSDRRGWPTCVRFDGGRLYWFGRDSIDGSISDAFDSFNDEFVGDAGPISRTIGSGPVDTIQWALSLQRLCIGGEGAERAIRASSLDEPLTPTNFNIKAFSTQGSAAVDAAQVDKNGIFVQRGGTRVFEVSWASANEVDYDSSDLSALIPEIGQPSITRIAVQRQPDTRVHFVRSDGTAAVLIFDKVEEVICWIEIETDGLIEDVCVLPGDSGEEEDWVYYSIARTINGSTKRYLEKWARESQCQGGAVNRQADSFITYNQAASATIGGLTHLIGESVVVWDNGVCLNDSSGNIATFVVNASGQITVTHEGSARLATVGVVGLAYDAEFKSSRMVELMQQAGGKLNDMQRIKGLGLLLYNTHALGLKYGASLTVSQMRDLPLIKAGAAVDSDSVHSLFTVPTVATPHDWENDTRLCLLAQAPRPCTVLAALTEVDHHG